MLYHTNEVKNNLTNKDEDLVALDKKSKTSSNISEIGIKSFPTFNKYNSQISVDNLLKNELSFLMNNTKVNLSFTNTVNFNNFEKIKKSFLSLFKIQYPEEFFAKVYEKKYYSIVGIDKNQKEVVCFSHIEINKSLRTADILTFGVIKEYQNLKIGSKLLQKVIEELTVMGIKKINLVVQESNTIAVHLYKKQGFINEKILENYYKSLKGDESHAILMQLDLCKKKEWYSDIFDKIKSCF